jgi:hypothetical protein
MEPNDTGTQGPCELGTFQVFVQPVDNRARIIGNLHRSYLAYGTRFL